MKVILLSDVNDLGKKGELKEVSEGYARNFLLPRKLAQTATADALNAYKLREESKAHKRREDENASKQLAADLKGATLKITAKGGTGGRLFGSITSKEIAALVQEQLGLTLDKKHIDLKEPIKTSGEHKIRVKTGFENSAELTVVVETA